MDGLDGEAEEEANAFASEILVPSTDYQEFLNRTLRISRQPSSISPRKWESTLALWLVGFRHDHYLNYSHLNDLKTRLVWETTPGG